MARHKKVVWEHSKEALKIDTGKVVRVKNVVYLTKKFSEPHVEAPAGGMAPPKSEPAKVIHALMVDDNYDFYKITQANASPYMEIEYASDGFTAFKMVRQKTYDLILCDIAMPLMNGIVMLTEMNKKHISTPLIFISGNMDEKSIREALQAGAYNVIQKPFDVDELVAKSRRALDLHDKDEMSCIENQDKAYIYNSLKSYYYDIDRISLAIQHYQIPAHVIKTELRKKELTGKCIFDDLHALKYIKV